ncbi:MAG: hypothetical protein J6I84_02610 [Bacilli bacterium]|nr:hypothetical protein [Bacilli bacterium]
MKIEFLPDKYRCNSNNGITLHKKEGLISDLSRVIDFEHSTYPKKWVDEGEKYVGHDQTVTDFLGDRRVLEPGDMFIHAGQVLAVNDPETLILCVSETGGFALQRFVNEVLAAELELLDTDLVDTEVKVEPVVGNEEKPTGEIAIPYYKMKAWREKLDRPEKATYPIKATINCPDLLLPVSIWIGDWEAWYMEEEIDDPDVAKDMVGKVLGWTYKNGLV